MSGYLDTRTLEKEIRDLALDKEIADDAEEEFDEDSAERLAALLALREEFDARQWQDGEGLVPESEWEDYARETAYDVGFVERGSAIEGYVDWEKWARDLTNDYSSVEFDGETYYFRSY
jgi:antirestriction protein